MNEENQHTLHVGIINRYKLITYAEIVGVLDEARRQITARTGTPL